MGEEQSEIKPARPIGCGRTKLVAFASSALVLAACSGSDRAGPSGVVPTASPTPVAATGFPTAPPEVTPTPFHHVQSIYVIVAAGDTLSLIADLYGWSLDAVEAANPQLGPAAGRSFSSIYSGDLVHPPSGSPLPPMPRGWNQQVDPARGYSIGIPPEYLLTRDSTPACPTFTTNTTTSRVPDWGPSDEGFGMCAVPASSCTNPSQPGNSRELTLDGVQVVERHTVSDGRNLPAGSQYYDVYVPGNGLCYEMHAYFMQAITDSRITAVITGLWSSFELRDIAA